MYMNTSCLLGMVLFILKVVVYSLPTPKYSDDFTVFNPLAFITGLNIPKPAQLPGEHTPHATATIISGAEVDTVLVVRALEARYPFISWVERVHICGKQLAQGCYPESGDLPLRQSGGSN